MSRNRRSRQSVPVPPVEPEIRQAVRSTRWRSLVTCLGLAIVVLAIYGQTAEFQFVNFDDDVHVSENPHVTTGITTQNLFWDFGIHGPSQWHPLAWLSHQLDCTWFGLKAGGHHLTSVLLHLLTSVTLFLAFQRLLKSWGSAMFIAAAFAVHPLNVESVAWISERRNGLCALFCTLMLWSYAAFASRPTVPRYLLVAVCHIAALMSKPLAVTMPCVLLLLDFWPLRRTAPASDYPLVPMQRLLIEKVPLLALSLGASVLTILCQRAVGTIATFEAIPLPLRLANAIAAYGWYVWKLLWPLDLGVFYPHPALVDAAPWTRLMPSVMTASVVLLGISLLAILYRRRYPWLLTGWLWYLGVMVPMIGIMQVGEQQQADRYAYLPLIGLFLILACAGATISARSRRLQSIVRLSACTVLLAWSCLAYLQTAIWRNSQTLFSHTVNVTERNHWAHNNLGMALLRQRKFADAAAQFHMAVLSVPSYGLAHYNLGVALHELRQTDAARRELMVALKLDPTNALAHQRLGALLIETGDTPAALEHFREAARLTPDDGDASFNLGLALLNSGNAKDAVQWLKAAIQLQPDRPAAIQALAIALREIDQTDEAISQLTRFLQAHPDATAVANLLVQLKSGR